MTNRHHKLTAQRLLESPALLPDAPLGLRLRVGTMAGLSMGFVFALVGYFTEPSVPWLRLLASNLIAGVAGGGTYGLLGVFTRSRLGAAAGMTVAVTLAATIAFYGWGYDLWRIGWFFGVSAGIAHAILVWKPVEAE